MTLMEHLRKPVSPLIEKFFGTALCIVCIGVFISYALILDEKADNRVTDMRAVLSSYEDGQETLHLAIEFGYDPLIVQIVRKEASIQFHQHACKCLTWRFVKSDKDLTYLLLSLIQTESRGDFKALNPAGPAYGLTQLLMSTARQYDGQVDQQQLLTIPKNVHIAVTHFVDLLERFHGNYTLAVIAWNRGANGVDRAIAIGQSPESGYARKVFTDAAMRNAGLN